MKEKEGGRKRIKRNERNRQGDASESGESDLGPV